MTVLENTITSAAMDVAADIDMVENFSQDVNKLSELLGIFGTETVAAGTALYQLKITGSLNETSSGAGYTEGDEVALSAYKADKVAVGDITPKPYRKLTTAQAILKGGQAAITKTDNKMLNQARDGIVADFISFLGNGTGTATGEGLQATLANVDATLGDTLENNADAASRIIHFISRQDAAEYLGKAEITVQNLFGMTYLQNFLGITDVFLTSKVAKGTVYATPVENVHIFGIDFGSLAAASLAYQTDNGGLIGVAHVPTYDRVARETNILVGAKLFAEVQDYIVKGTVTVSA